MKVASVPLLLALVGAALLAASGYGARFGVWDYRFGFQLVRLEPLRGPRGGRTGVGVHC